MTAVSRECFVIFIDLVAAGGDGVWSYRRCGEVLKTDIIYYICGVLLNIRPHISYL